MNRYNTIKFNDIANAPGICVSVYLQGCPHHCPGCFNPETWDFNGGKEFTEETMQKIIKGLIANGIQRSLCILGGEPLCEENAQLTHEIVTRVKKVLPETKIYIWTGDIYENLIKSKNFYIKHLISNDYLEAIIDGPFIQELRDITLPMRGSSNQRIITLNKKGITQ